ncbi:hypothetical protein NUU61_003124 [Penicillium alfredii]|uniref:Uncharacterized protein n=1 Tax=Penicillium alfredii TaxID=1506179 RepID=A0A9W9FSZ8_9EURO|nr:uncharacterized protein NUU61_003124 [Penicillium alfredii]KAJ5105777.1 hypothetical protein NUU61_003124 [Penicillium alfredii]
MERDNSGILPQDTQPRPDSQEIQSMLMQRPRSSGINISGFAFKPVPRRQDFALRGSIKPIPLASVSSDSSQPVGISTENKNDDQLSPSMERCFRSYLESQQSPLENRGSSKQISVPEQPTSAMNMESTLINECDTHHAASASNDLDRTSPQEHASVPSRRASNMIPPELNVADVEIQSPGSTGVNSCQRLDSAKSRLVTRTFSKSNPIRKAQRIDSNISLRSSSRVPSVPTNDGLRVSKRRCDNRKHKGSEMQTLIPSNKPGVQLTENDLFELLIARIRQREEIEARAAEIQEQIESENSELLKDNQTLRDQLATCNTQLRKKSSDAKAHRTQMKNWKASLSKFKQVVNELGQDYDVLRERMNTFKTTATSLGMEKSEIEQSIGEMKVQVSKAKDHSGSQQKKIVECEGRIVILEQALCKSEESEKGTRMQLSEEKRRVSVLESYIQNSSRNQTRQLSLVWDHQQNLIEKLNSVFELITGCSSESQDAIISQISPVLDRCVSSVQALDEKCSAERMEVEQFTASTQRLASRIDSIADQFSKIVERSSETNLEVSKSLKEDLQSVERSLGPESSFFKQLVGSEKVYSDIQERLYIIQPSLDSLDASVKAISNTGHSLLHGMKGLEERLAEAQVPVTNPILELELSSKFDENTQLQLQLQEVSIELESLRKQFGDKEAANEDLRLSLQAAVDRERKADDRNTELEIEKTTLQHELFSNEQRLPEELSKAKTASQEETRADYEQRLHILEEKNAGLEKASQALAAGLADAQVSLTKAQGLAETQREEKENLLQEMHQQIQDLQVALAQSAAQSAAQIEDQANEIRLHQESATALQAEKESLLDGLQQSSEMIRGLEERLGSKTEVETLEEVEELQSKITVLESVISQKSEELREMGKSLAAANSAISNFGTGKEKAKAEILSLLHRVQEAERWQTTIQHTLTKLAVVDSDEPFEESWGKFEIILQAAMAKNAFKNSPNTPVANCNDVTVCQTPALASTPKPRGGSPQGMVQTTELIYRTHSIQPRTLSSPAPGDILRSVIADSQPDTIPKPQVPPGNIVPFATVQRELSPNYASSQYDDATDFAMLFMSGPDELAPSTPLNIPKHPMSQMSPEMMMDSGSKPREPTPSSQRLECMAGQVNRDKTQAVQSQSNSLPRGTGSPETLGTKRKAVSFKGARHTAAAAVSRHSSSHSTQPDTEMEKEDTIKKAKRTHKRTYSRIHHSSGMAQQMSFQASRATSVTSREISRSSQYGSNKAKSSAVSQSKSVREQREASGVFERRPSPKGLAAGSSKSHVDNRTSGTRGRERRRSRGTYGLGSGMIDPANSR